MLFNMYCKVPQAYLLLVRLLFSSWCFLNSFSTGRTLTRTSIPSGAVHADSSRLKHGGKGHRYVGIQQQFQPDSNTFPSFPPQQQQLFSSVSADCGRAPVEGREGISSARPTVRCGNEAMIITFLQQAMDSFLIERYLTSTPLPLSHLPSGCGLSVRTTWTEVVLIAHYNGCFILLEEDKYILPVVWQRSRMKASCPVRVPFPRIVCTASSMDLIVFGEETVGRLKVLLNGRWVRLHYAAERCRFLSYAKSESVVFSVPFTTCGLIQKGGMYRIYIRSREREMELSCPLQIPSPPRHQSNMLPSSFQMQTISDPALDALLPEVDIHLLLSGVTQQEQHKLPNIQQQHSEADTQHLSAQPTKVHLPFTHNTARLPALPPMTPGPFELSLNIPIISNRLPQPSLGDISSAEHNRSELLRLIPAFIASGLSGLLQSHQELPNANLQRYTTNQEEEEISTWPHHFPDSPPFPPPPSDSHMDPVISVPPPHLQLGHVAP
ncbi:uncharacterized protein LOC115361332 isoform X2 [Myripristis murdjan]|uniref:uncharacterized protein LOC115361332 isoform X2 n=1 Tax=Myripristis murdjan TaxID=586833 RepID=UPI001175D3CA|nr:uncharacterized protein LOC115361332 isoform X2 [Myripristis murdjan]